MEVKEFLQIFAEDADFRKQSRFLIIGNDEERTEFLKSLYDSPYLERVRISDLIHANTIILSAARLLSDLPEKIESVNQQNKIALIDGLDAMLNLWPIEKSHEAFEMIQHWIDRGKLRFLIYMREYSIEAQNTFNHPRYAESQSVLRIGLKETSENPVKNIRIISSEFRYSDIAGKALTSLRGYVREYENGLLMKKTSIPKQGGESEEVLPETDTAYNLFMDREDAEFVNVRKKIETIFTKRDFLGIFCGLNGYLSDAAVDFLYEKMRGTPKNVLIFAKEHFFSNGLNDAPEKAPAMIWKAPDAVKEILVWVLKSSLQPDTYLYQVLTADGFTIKDFAELYVCKALDLLRDPRKDNFVVERKEAISEIGTDQLTGWITQFIKQSKQAALDEIAPWMNLGTDLEKTELLRRYMESAMENIPKSVLNVYPQLKAYMAPYQLGNEKLNTYFTEYRLLKILNKVTADFCEKAKESKGTVPGISSRDALVQNLAKDSDTGLLVVDGLGAEYLPMLIELAKEKQIGLKTAEVVSTKLPTSTEFNKIDWPAERRLPEVKALDNNVHNGPEAHTTKPYEEDLRESLEIIDQNVMNAVASAMGRYRRIILTSDHGSSRLAVLASNQNFTKQIKLSEKFTEYDSRYTKLPSGKVENYGMIQNLNGTYYVVTGYDSIAKTGSKQHETHGGATYEESLVPFMVFEQGATFVPKAQQESKTEFSVDSDFDDL